MPEIWRVPLDSEETWPNRSISRALLMAMALVVGGDLVEPVGIVDREAAAGRVVIEEIVEFLRTEGEGVDEFADIVLLLAIGDAARLVDIDKAVAEHLGMHPEVAQVGGGDQFADGVGHGADAELQAGAVLDLGNDDLGDLLVDIGDLRLRQAEHLLVVALDDGVDLGDMDLLLVAAVAVRHVLVHLDDDLFRRLDLGPGKGIGDPEIEEALAVHRRGPQQHDIGGDIVVFVVARPFMVEQRDIVADLAVVEFAVGAGKMPAVVAEALPFRIGLGDRRLAGEAERRGS